MFIVQGWSSVIPQFSIVDFASFYIEIPFMLVMYFAWLAAKKGPAESQTEATPLLPTPEEPGATTVWYQDLVDPDSVDLRRDEYEEVEVEDISSDRHSILTSLYNFFA